MFPEVNFGGLRLPDLGVLDTGQIGERAVFGTEGNVAVRLGQHRRLAGDRVAHDAETVLGADDEGEEAVEVGEAGLERLAETTGYTFNHYLQTNLIGWNEGWNNVVHSMFDSSLGTSMDYPNSHRRLKNGSTEQYTKLWLKAVKEAQSAGIDVGLIAVLHQDTLNSDPADFYRFFTETAGIGDFQVNMPFPGGPNEGAGTLDVEPLSKFLLGLLEVWLKEGRDQGVKLGPFSELIEQFAGRPTNLPCIWQPNCANEFLAVDARGQTALCDCWVTSYPQHSFGNIFGTQNIAQMLRGSEARERFKERPGYLIENTECRSCEWLSMCHGGCPVRTFTAKETIYAKDPYCEVYKAIFSVVEIFGVSANSVDGSAWRKFGSVVGTVAGVLLQGLAYALRIVVWNITMVVKALAIVVRSVVWVGKVIVGSLIYATKFIYKFLLPVRLIALALFTRMSIPPKCSTVSWTAANTCSSPVSRFTTLTWPPIASYARFTRPSGPCSINDFTRSVGWPFSS